MLMACWCRPPKPGNLECIEAFREELHVHRLGAVGTVVIGDINVYSKRWMVHSSGESPEGTRLHEICEDEGLKQIVKSPTRNENLLDLVMTDISGTETEVGGKIQDHRFVLTKLKVRVPETKLQRREVWNFKKADWTRLKEDLSEHDWSCLQTLDPNDGAIQFTKVLRECSLESIGKRVIHAAKSTHPWMTEQLVKLVAGGKSSKEPPRKQRRGTDAVLRWPILKWNM